MYPRNATLAQGEYYYGHLSDIPQGCIVETRNLQSCIGILLKTSTRYLLAHVDKDEGLDDILKDNNATQFFREMMEEAGIEATLVGGDYPVFSSDAIGPPFPNKIIEKLTQLEIPYTHQHYSREISLLEAIITALALTFFIALSPKRINHLSEFIFYTFANLTLIVVLRHIQHSTYKLSVNHTGKINISLTSTFGFPHEQENIAGLSVAQQRDSLRRLIIRSKSPWEERFLPLTLFHQPQPNDPRQHLEELDGYKDPRRLLAYDARQRKHYFTEFTHVVMLTHNANKPTTIPNSNILIQRCDEDNLNIFWEEYGEIIERQIDTPADLTIPEQGQNSSDKRLIHAIIDQLNCVPSNDPNICKTSYAKLSP